MIEVPVIEGARVRMRAPRASDFEAYAAFCASHRARILGGPWTRPQAFGRLCAVAGHWALRGYGRWMVADRETDAPLGVVGPFFPEGWPEPEIAWTVFGGAEGRGIAFEAATLSRRHAYETLGWRTVVSCVAPDNARSQALARRLGCEVDGRFEHPEAGPLDIWRHPGPEAAA